MADLRAKGIRLTARGFDLERKKLFKPNSSLILLKADGGEVEYAELRTFEKGFMVRYNKFRNVMEIEIATLDDLASMIGKTDALAFDGTLFSVEEGDVVAPFGDRFTWLISCKVSFRAYP